MIDYAGFEVRARVIDDRLRVASPTFGEATHTKVTRFCDHHFPIADGQPASSERFTAYRVLCLWELERIERALEIVAPELE